MRDGEKTKTGRELGFSLHAIGQNLMLSWGSVAGKQMANAADRAVCEETGRRLKSCKLSTVIGGGQGLPGGQSRGGLKECGGEPQGCLQLVTTKKVKACSSQLWRRQRAEVWIPWEVPASFKAQGRDG